MDLEKRPFYDQMKFLCYYNKKRSQFSQYFFKRHYQEEYHLQYHSQYHHFMIIS
jgi:hypothetical protein